MKNRCLNAVGAALCGRTLPERFPNSAANRRAPLKSLSLLRRQDSMSFFKNHIWIPGFTGVAQSKFKGRLGGIFLLTNSKGVSVIFLIVAMLLMVILAYVFSYLIPTKQKSVVYPIQSTQAFFLAQSGVEFAVRFAKDNGWTTKTLLNTNLGGGVTRSLGSGSFTVTYASSNDTLTSVGYVPTSTQRREIVVSNFSSFTYYFAYHKTITVQANKVSNGPLTNFPMLVSITDTNLETVANGGHVASYNAGTNNPWDLVFFGLDDTTCGGVAGSSPCKLSHEIELYNQATGQLIAWVLVPSITSTATGVGDTVIYMYYGNPCMTASTQNPSGVWANYSGVWHSGQSATPLTDSTGNNNLATNSTQITGEIGYAQSYNGTTQLASKTANVVNIPANNANQTISVWFYGAADNTVRSGASFVNPNGNGSGIQFGQRTGGTNGAVGFWQWGGTFLGGTQASPTAGTWHYMVYTFDGTTHHPYFDGTALTTATTPAAQTGTPTQIYFSTYNSTAEFWNGGIDEVRISNSGIVRSAGWIATEYSNQSNPGSLATAGFYAVGAEQNN